jgi:hypothetical protein
VVNRSKCRSARRDTKEKPMMGTVFGKRPEAFIYVERLFNCRELLMDLSGAESKLGQDTLSCGPNFNK